MTGASDLITARERQVIQSLLEGATAREVAQELELSLHTVRTHIRNIYGKTGVTSRLELLRWQIESDSDSYPKE